MDLRHSIEVIHPPTAKQMLETNRGNRHPNVAAIGRYADDMAAGRWHVGTSVIIFNEDGDLIDGQHRLQACVQAGVPFTSLVVRGVSREARPAIDQGVKRSLSHVLTWKGHVSTASLGAAVKAAWVWQNTGTPFNRSTFPTNDQSLAWLELNPSMPATVKVADQLKKALGVPLSTVAAFLHWTTMAEPEATDEFVGKMKLGVGLEYGDPALALREWVLRQATSNVTSRKPLPAVYCQVFVTAWNAQMEGRPMKQAKYVKRDTFPELLDASGEPISMANELGRSQAKAA